MITITRFTKEQLLKRLEEQMSSARYALGFVQDSEILRDIEMDLRITEIALASLEAEPVAWTDADELRDAKNGGNGYLFAIGGNANKFADPRRQMMLYAAPPAPVVPEEVLADLEYQANHITDWHHIDEHSCKVNRRDLLTLVNACRAAMLQGQPVSNRDELPVSEIECDICGFKSTDPDGAHYCCEDNSND